MAKVRCCFCRGLATGFYVTLNNCLWSTCEQHAAPFRGTAVELDEESYDLEEYFAENYEEEDEEGEQSLDPV